MLRGLLVPLTKIVEDDPEEIVVRNKIEKWAVHHRYSLVFMSSMFIITWTLMVVFKWVV